MNLLGFGAASSLLFVGMAGLFVTYIIVSTEQPWMIDSVGNADLLGITPDELSQLLSKGPDAVNISRLLQSHYQMSATAVGLASTLILIVVLLAPRNGPLLFAANLATFVALLLGGLSLQHQSSSQHAKLWHAAFSCATVGMLSALVLSIKQKSLASRA